MAGLKCVNPRCRYAMYIPDDATDIAKLRMPSAQIECPKCHKRQPASDAWIAYEAAIADLDAHTAALGAIARPLGRPAPLHLTKNGRTGLLVP